MHKISKLPPEIQKRICAGEVIVSPYNVLKEIIENSIDAGSSFISVVVSKDNLNIEIHDNGCGIHEKDFENLALPHHTSKYIENLYNLESSKFPDTSNLLIYGDKSYGFRGEALSSIRCVSNLIIKSKTEDSEIGFIKNFKEDTLTPISMNTGTSIYIKNLFYNNKIREKYFYKKLSVFKDMHELVNIFSIKNSNIRFQFNEINYCFDESLLDIRPVLNSVDFPHTLEAFKKDYISFDNIMDTSNIDQITSFKSRQITNIYNISPMRYFCNEFIRFIFTSTMVNMKNFHFILFINERLVSNQNIKSLISKIYSTILPKGRHPFVYLEIRIPTKFIDVNVHPSKKEVLIEYEDLLLEVIAVILEGGLNEPKGVYKGGVDNLITKNTDLVYKEYNTLEDCLPRYHTHEYNLLSIKKLKDEIAEVDKTFLKDIVFVGLADLPDTNLLVQYNQYLMKCNLTLLKPFLIYQYFLYNFGNFKSTTCCIKNSMNNLNKGMLKEYFNIVIEDCNIVQVPLIGDYSGDHKEWEKFHIENYKEEEVFREIFNKFVNIYRNLEMNRNIFSILKRDMKCTKEVLDTFTILKSLKDLYKCFERC